MILNNQNTQWIEKTIDQLVDRLTDLSIYRYNYSTKQNSHQYLETIVEEYLEDNISIVELLDNFGLLNILIEKTEQKIKDTEANTNSSDPGRGTSFCGGIKK